MLSYPLTWTPAAVFLATVVILTTPFLGLIALLVLPLVVLAALAKLVVVAAHQLWPFVHRLRHERSSADRRRPVVSLAPRHAAQLVIRDGDGSP